MYIPCNLKFMKKRPEAVARSWWIFIPFLWPSSYLLCALLWKLLIFQFYTAMYIPCNLEFMKKRPEAVARLCWILQKICFITFKSYIPKHFFLVKRILSESIHDLTLTSQNRSDTYWSPCMKFWRRHILVSNTVVWNGYNNTYSFLEA